MTFTGIERQRQWPPSDPTEHRYEWSQPNSPWTYENDGPNPALEPSTSHSAQQLRSRKRRGDISAVPPYHPDYEPPAEDLQDESDDEGGGDDDDGERFAEYEHGRRAAHVRRGSEGYEVRPIDREQLLAEYIVSRAQEEGHYRRYVPEPESEPVSESGEDGVVREDGRDYEWEDEDEPLAVRVEKWRSGEAIS